MAKHTKVIAVTLTAGQKAAATKRRMKAELVATQAAELAAYNAMTAGQKAAFTKAKTKANGHTAPVITAPVITASIPAGRTPEHHARLLAAGKKAAETKAKAKAMLNGHAAPVVTAPVVTAPVVTAPVAPVAMSADTLARLLALAPMLKTAGLI
jgi:hypothetical protein